jgi:anaerobic selenocysteine-containing dehydrogenase
MKKLSRRNFLKRAAATAAGLTAAATAKVVSDQNEPPPYAQSQGDVIHSYFLDKGWRKTFEENDLEICVFDSARCKWLSLKTIDADDIETKRAIWS